MFMYTHIYIYYVALFFKGHETTAVSYLGFIPVFIPVSYRFHTLVSYLGFIPGFIPWQETLVSYPGSYPVSLRNSVPVFPESGFMPGFTFDGQADRLRQRERETDNPSMLGYSWMCLDMLGYAWVWTCSDMLGYAWISLAMLGYAWMSGYACIYPDKGENKKKV